jgi:class 3 adenylate cyclase
VLAPGRQLAVSHVAFLFSDLKGSTRLYEGLGDAPAYSRVSRHFGFIRQAVSRGGGGIVKTMGDGVMCTFHRLDDALGQADRSIAERSGVTAEPFTTRLRGLDEDRHLVRLTGAASRAARV